MNYPTTLEKFESELWTFHFPVEASVAKQFIDGTNRRIKCTINGHINLQCALMPDGNRGYFILVNKKVRESLGLKVGDPVMLTIEKDTSQHGHPVPESFQAILEQDPEGARLFERLTPGKQRSLVYIVGKVKSIESQINKGLAIVEHLKQETGQLDFRKLNTLIKEYNNRKRGL